MHSVWALTCALVWRVGTLCWTSLFLHSLHHHPPLPPNHHCPLLHFGWLAPLNWPQAPCASWRAPPARHSQQSYCRCPTLLCQQEINRQENKPSGWIVPYWSCSWALCCFCCARILLTVGRSLQSSPMCTCSDLLCRLQLWVCWKHRVTDCGWSPLPQDPQRWGRRPSLVWCQ